MSSPVSAPPLRLERRPSRRLTVVLAGLHALALLVALPLPVPWWVKLLVIIAVAAQWVAVWRRHLALSAPAAVRRLTWSADDRWELITADGAAREARLLPGSYVHTWLVVLRFITADRRRRAVVLPADGLAADDHRRLRVRLRMGG